MHFSHVFPEPFWAATHLLTGHLIVSAPAATCDTDSPILKMDGSQGSCDSETRPQKSSLCFKSLPCRPLCEGQGGDTLRPWHSGSLSLIHTLGGADHMPFLGKRTGIQNSEAGLLFTDLHPSPLIYKSASILLDLTELNRAGGCIRSTQLTVAHRLPSHLQGSKSVQVCHKCLSSPVQAALHKLTSSAACFLRTLCLGSPPPP